MLLLEIEKKKEVNTKYFSETTRVDQTEPSVQSEQAELDQWRKCLAMRKLSRTRHRNRLLVPYVNNPSEETIFGSNKIRLWLMHR